MGKTFILFAMLGTVVVARAQSDGYTYLTAESVQSSWNTQSCSIDTMLIEVMPKGLYAEVSVTMDFSTRGISFSDYDSLELSMMFQLPPDVEVTDMWLWVFGQPEKAGVYDRWTASQIYEEIVDRRTDPAILYHYTWYDYYTNNSISNLYRFNIFPMLNDLPRKAKITYQVPLKNINSELVSVPLPMNMGHLSQLALQQYTLRYYPGNEFGAVQLMEQPSTQFVDQGPYREIDLLPLSGESLTLAISPIRPSTYLGVYSDLVSNIDYYQFGFVPNQVFALPASKKKSVVLFDLVDQGTGGISAATAVNTFKSSYLPQFTDQDSINVATGGFINNWLANDWLSTDATNLDWIDQHLTPADISGQSNLNDLILDAIQFITEHGGQGDILLISNSNWYDALESSNSLIQLLTPMLTAAGIRLTVLDLDAVNTYSEDFWLANERVYGNSYLFSSLAAATGGEYHSIQTMAYTDMLASAIRALDQVLSALDVYVTRTSGLTYANYDVGSNTIQPYVTQPVGRSGISAGTGDWTVNLTAVGMDGTIYQSQQTIAESEVFTLDTVTDNIWGGLRQRAMYGLDQSNALIQSIVQNSKDHRVLSKYTAFLALEPSEGPLPITNPNPGGGWTNVEEETQAENLFSTFPNPFTDRLNVDVALIANAKLEMKLMDVQGREVSTLLSNTIAAGRSVHSFDLSDLQSGIYFLSITSGTSITTLKVVKM